MRRFTMRTFVPETDVQRVYARLSDFPSYLGYAKSVRSVEMRHRPGEPPTSAWEVDFRGGILRWVEEDEFHPDERRIDFRQVQGDLEAFTGSWLVEPADEGSMVTFVTEFDLGIPTLQDVLEPIAEEALYENVEGICTGLFGAGTRPEAAWGEAVEDIGAARADA